MFRFLLLSVNIEAILQEQTIYRRRERLSKISDGLELGDAYGTMIERIRAQGTSKSRIGMDALMWISHAERPLTPGELCQVLAVELGSTDFKSDNAPSISIVVGCSQGLITMDGEGSTVRLIHVSLNEYLSTSPDIFSRPHAAMAEICLTYLNSKTVKALSADTSSDSTDTPLLHYCSVYWGVHAKRELSDNGTSLALDLFREYDSHISKKLLLEQEECLEARGLSTFSPFTGLHCASFFGITEVVATLIKMGYDINSGDFGGHTSLAWAAHNGHDDVVKMLLELEQVDPNKLNAKGRTPLSHAAGNGHDGVVRILVGREGVKPNKPDDDGLTPLAWAAQAEHAGAVEILLGREGVKPDKADAEGRTPLMWAAEAADEAVVKILLGREDVNPDTADDEGWTPLFYAASSGHEGIVKMLLLRDEVNPSRPALDGETPLFVAARYGYSGVVKLLLEMQSVNPDKPDKHGRTPLSVAAERGLEGVVKILLEQEGVNPDRWNHAGRTPLSFAAHKGREGVVKILLEQAGVNPDGSDNVGKTPLSWAAQEGHGGVVKMLLGRKEVNPDRPDTGGQTPLIYAARGGHKRVMALLQVHQGVPRTAVGAP